MGTASGIIAKVYLIGEGAGGGPRATAGDQAMAVSRNVSKHKTTNIVSSDLAMLLLVPKPKVTIRSTAPWTSRVFTIHMLNLSTFSNLHNNNMLKLNYEFSAKCIFQLENQNYEYITSTLGEVCSDVSAKQCTSASDRCISSNIRYKYILLKDLSNH